jgi:hypothetical protein
MRNAALAVPAACLALAVGACGNNDDAPPASTATTPTTTTTGEAARPTAERREFERRIRAALRAQGQAEAVEIDCVIAELRGTLSNQAVEDAVAAVEAGEQAPRNAVDAAFDAGERCRRPSD